MVDIFPRTQYIYACFLPDVYSVCAEPKYGGRMNIIIMKLDSNVVVKLDIDVDFPKK